MVHHVALAPLSHEHQRLLFVCSYLKADAAAHEGVPLETADKLAYIVKVFQEVMVPHIQKEEYLFEICAGKNAALDALIQELLVEHQQISRMYSALTEQTNLETAMDQLARSLEAHIQKEEQVFFEQLQQNQSALLDSICWENQ
ncbi:MAG TPA: hemerythrin domain-containing protein [Chitinophaga sp.]|uniref:hemerythrin domain-containing protein n=1 Tax=Chitinophaga sp. TaxID=1869181 RepID=UPI002DBF691B|nr:hemerythrin domain-containing protein [Chitinophaga sp.]HEU4553903.1 hemerythrin domain-containing protein [Chitinophaga sp.]